MEDVQVLVQPLHEFLDDVADQIVIVGEENAHGGHPSGADLKGHAAILQRRHSDKLSLCTTLEYANETFGSSFTNWRFINKFMSYQYEHIT